MVTNDLKDHIHIRLLKRITMMSLAKDQMTLANGITSAKTIVTKFR